MPEAKAIRLSTFDRFRFRLAGRSDSGPRASWAWRLKKSFMDVSDILFAPPGVQSP